MQLLNEKCGLERKCADLRVVCLFLLVEDFIKSVHLLLMGLTKTCFLFL